jgi:hypothetical protein
MDKNRMAKDVQLGSSVINTRLTADEHDQNVQDIEINL